MFPKIEFNHYDLKKKIFLPTRLTPDLAELCGIHIGDGHMGYRKEKCDYIIQCGGHPINDKEHYDKCIKKLWEKLFNVKIKLEHRKDGTYGFYFYSKTIMIFFNKVLEMPIGKKSKIVRIPNIIKNTCKNNKISKEMIACLRGIIDTDFYFVSDRGYPVLGAWFSSRDLVLDLSSYLTLFGLKPKIRLDIKYYNTSSKKYLIRHEIRIRRKDDVNKWFDLIKTHNQKFYKRYNDFMNCSCRLR